MVGYWKPLPSSPMAEFMADFTGRPEQPRSEFPDPNDHVDPTWKERYPDLYRALCSYLRAHPEYNAYKGWSTCRICGKPNGSREFTDGSYYWPEGLVHYVEDHDVVIPDSQFLLHITKKCSFKVNQIGATSGRLSSAGSNLANFPRPDTPEWEVLVRFRVPTFKEEAKALAHLRTHGVWPTGVMVLAGDLVVVENSSLVHEVVDRAYSQRPRPEDIRGILEANSVKGPPEDFDIKVSKG